MILPLGVFGGGKMRAGVLCGLFGLGLAALASPLVAGDDAKGAKKPPPGDAHASVETFSKKIDLDAGQKDELSALKKEYTLKLAQLDVELAKILTPDRPRVKAAALAPDPEHANQEQAAAASALQLSDDEKEKLLKIEEQRHKLYRELGAKKNAVLTPGQREQLSEHGASNFILEFAQKIFQPLLLFFYLGFLIPILKVPYRFPQQIYQGITLYLLVAIGWHGSEELAKMNGSGFAEALGFMGIGFGVNVVIAILAYNMLRFMTRMRKVDCAMVGGYYGSDSAGTFLTGVGVLLVMGYREIGYMPVLLAVMETPGCLVCLYQIARFRRTGMDRAGNMPDEPGYAGPGAGATRSEKDAAANSHAAPAPVADQGHAAAVHDQAPGHVQTGGMFNWGIIHEVFFNPGLYFLFGGLFIGLVAGLLFIPFNKEVVIESENLLFVTLMHGILCLFLLEMGITACEHLRDLKAAGPGFIVFGLLAPNIFAVIGISAAHFYSVALGHAFPIPYYALFAILCAAASYIAVPAVQRMAIPEASPTLPLAASLGLTFTYNVTFGIPIYIAISELFIRTFPVAAYTVQ